MCHIIRNKYRNRIFKRHHYFHLFMCLDIFKLQHGFTFNNSKPFYRLWMIVSTFRLPFRPHSEINFSCMRRYVFFRASNHFQKPPSFVPVILTTLLMSFGFHFFEAVNQSLLLQYFDVRTTPVVMGKLRGLAAGGSLAASVFVFFCSDFLPYTMMFLIVGALCMFTGVWGLFLDPTNKELPIQSKKMVFRRKYWLFYLLTLFLGARRQIFIVFALFLLVEHFRFSVNTVSVLFMINYAINWFLNPLIGRTINRIGERKLLSIEYSTAILVFTGYATTGSAWVAGVLYVIDYIVFNFSIALRTFFQKIAEPQDIAPTMAVAQTINHIAAIFVPALGGWLWVEFGYQIPFFIGAALSGCSLLLVQIIDREIRLHAPAKA